MPTCKCTNMLRGFDRNKMSNAANISKREYSGCLIPEAQ